MSEVILSRGHIPPAFSLTRRMNKDKNLSRKECFTYQLARIASFRNLQGSRAEVIDPFSLSAKGFYFSEQEEDIICCVCEQTLRQYQDNKDDPQDLHLRDNPNCPGANGNIIDNKPLALIEDEIDSPIVDRRSVSEAEKHSIDDTSLDFSQNRLQARDTTDQENHNQVQGATSVTDQNSPIQPPLGATIPQDVNMNTRTNIHNAPLPGEHHSAPRPSPAPRRTRTSPNDENTAENVQNPPAQSNTNLSTQAPMLEPESFLSEERKEQLFREENRFSTFQGVWMPYSQIVRAEDLARQGFFYIGPDDRVMCVFCKGILRRWTRGDRVEDEHARHFRACPFVSGSETRNIPIPRPQPRAAPSAQTQRSTGRPNRPNVEMGAASRAGSGSVQMTRRPLTTSQRDVSGATHPEFVKENKRLRSFDTSQGWPVESAITPENLAAAGFYYTGQSDNVRCFHCDGGLRNWEVEDDPWVEHARWFPKCAYLNSKKDSHFIEINSRRYPVKKQQPAVPAPPPVVSSSELPEGLKIDKKFYREARAMGFSDAQIKEALEKDGQSLGSMQALTDALLALMPTTGPVAESEQSHQASGSATSKGTDKTKGKDELGEQPPDAQQNQSKKKRKKAESTGTESNVPLTGPEYASPAYLLEEEGSRSLSEENRQLKEQRMCKVCMDEDVSIVFLPCGHLVCCDNCAPAMRACPICRALVRGTIRTFLS